MIIHQYSRNGPSECRRGVVLILVLGMLALLALIGVTFATFASQAKIGARNFAQTVNTPVSADLMDYALSQLINDTDNPLSAIRGHSLKRDMYGTDGTNNGILTSTSGGPLYITSSVTTPANSFVTNIPYVTGTSYSGWILKLAPTAYGFDLNGNPVVANNGAPPPTFSPLPTLQSFVIVADGMDSSGSYHQFQLSTPDSTTLTNDLINNAGTSALILPANVLSTNPFILDGRYRLAFNGPGITDAYAPFTDSSGTSTNLNPAQFANYRVNQGFLQPNLDLSTVTTAAHGNPNSVGMDEDYDACDLENWFMAIQSADGNIVMPSFHRPGILTTNDWSSSAVKSMAKILRPRSIDHGPNNPFNNGPGGVESPQNNQPINYDIDNDGDGKTDSVWLDLGYAPRRNANGKLYKPLFAFMVIGLNGRIPLNTAGNLAGRDDNGNQLSGQATHLGNSVSEVDPTYALQNAYNNAVNLTNPLTGNAYGQNDDAGSDVRSVQLQNLLAGTRPIPPELMPTNPLAFTSAGVPANGSNSPVGTANFGDMNYAPIGTDAVGNILRYYMPNGVVDTSDYDSVNGALVTDPTTQYVARIANTPNPVPGRWGEASSISGLNPPTGTVASLVAPYLTNKYNNPARAGYSLGDRDVDDDNLNAFDPYGTNGVAHQGEVADSDLYDSSNAPMLPVERIRRFVTPADIDGSGHVIQWPGSSSTTYGGDSYGRVAFFSYFRPAGLPGSVGTNGLLTFATSALDVNNNPIPAVDVTNNPLHGYDFYRFPFLANATRNSQRVGGMPTNSPLDTSQTPPAITATTGTVIPTYDTTVNGYLHTDGLNDADEMNLYAVNRNDQPYSASDLEWLYRLQDVDGSYLNSRLSQLAPVSFTNTAPLVDISINSVVGSDSLRRRRLFSTDSWELNNYAWANDNPQNAFPNNSIFTSPTANTGLNVSSNLVQNGYTSVLGNYKKINLNYPLPVSNDNAEPVRQKWIRETYLTLKAVLPPLAVDTAEELADLSQFVVNIIDFRDPDCAMTRFVNTDITVTAATTTTSPVLTLTPSPTSVTNPYSPTHLPADGYLIQYGMEYNPIAINEILAYSFMYNSSSSQTNLVCKRDNRFFIELVNTLTDTAVPGSNGLSSSYLNLNGFGYTLNDPYINGSWDLLFTKDDPLSRPDPFTGQLLNSSGSYYALIPLNRDAFNAAEGGVDLTLPPLPPTGDPSTKANMNPTTLPTNYFYVIGNPSPVAGQETYEATKTTATPASIAAGSSAPTLCRLLNTTYDPFSGSTNPSINFYPGVLPGITSTSTTAPANYQWKIPTAFPIIGSSKKKFTAATDSKSLITYYWACLRRPANPFAPVSATNPMVVVDAVRFPYMDATNNIDATNTPTSPPTVTQATGYLAYSVQRWQPYRGGHAVPLPENTGLIDSRFGYTEQMVPPANHFSTAQLATYGSKGIFDKNNSSNILYATSPIYHSLGEPGGLHATTGLITSESWNYLPFNDRDFTSVAELLLVPGCSPGLFTKQFAEFAPGTTNSTILSAATPQVTPVLGTSSTSLPAASNQASNYFNSTATIVPTAAPYLVDKFFYGASNTDTVNTTSNVDNQTSAGWYKMFEFFEVPSQSMGAYGPVAQGANFDWYRQDVKPGLINLNLIIDEEVFLSVMGKQSSNYTQSLLDFTAQIPPLGLNVATGITLNTDGTFAGYVTSSISNIGNINGGNPALKAAFVQFLKLRHGGGSSGFPTSMFGFGTGVVGTSNAVERPFRSLSYSDINQTVMRPASLPPSASSSPVNSTTAAAGYVGDPGLKNPFRYPGHTAATAPAANVLPPAIPARRLFQPPDTTATSNASISGDIYFNSQATDGSLAVGITPPSLISSTAYLGSGTNDNSQQPYFRTEMLQKAMNLTTVRTHQYAVWITIGFFEVTRPGNPDLVDTAPSLAYDQLGREIGLNGNIVRYRGFYVVDRTKATGFNPANPGDYHNCVVYGHVIQ